MINSASSGASGTYEQWVLTIREWEKDPTVSLANLPLLTTESFNPATFKRLLKHIDRALNKVDLRWNESLQKALEQARNTHELELALVQSRNHLYRRIQLCNHPSLPEEIRTSLMNDTRAKITDWQQQLESSLCNTTSRASVDLKEQEIMLQLVRKTPLTAVLSETYQHSHSSLTSSLHHA